MKIDDGKQKQENGVTRRTFVQVSAAGVALAATPRLLARPSATGSSAARPAVYSHRGAMFCTRYASDGRGWEGVRSAPALGQYSSGDTGALDTHITLAKKYGLSFFLAESATDDPRDYRFRNVERLYERADLHEFRTAVMLTGLTLRNSTPSAATAEAWLSQRLQNFASSSIVDHDSYLRDTKGRAIVAVNAGTAARDVAGAAQRLFRGTDLHESLWLWVIGDGGSRPAELAPGIAWVAQPQAGGLRDALRHDEVTLLPVTADTSGANVPNDRLSAYARGRYIVVDSFNDWKRRTALEPTQRDRSRALYVTTFGEYLDAIVR